jgi:glycosyltransferase involved in cell wall biosynthesis
MKPIRVLAFTPIPEEGAGARFRLYQYLPALEEAGFQVTIEPFFTPEFFRIVYQAGRQGVKLHLFIKQTLARLKQLLRRVDYDLFFVYREVFPIGPPLVELLLSSSRGRPLIYDFDDAIYLPNASDANRLIGVLKYPQKVPRIIRASTQVIVGNAHLADYARKHNEWVSVIPTCVNTSQFIPRSTRTDSQTPLRVGWVGSHSTAKYLRHLLPVLAGVAGRHPFTLYAVGSSMPLEAEGLAVTQAPWALEREIQDFQSCDIGVYPIWNDPWGQGKCGFKAIQFMACGVPVVASAVGVNRHIIQDGVNGFLAETGGEWADKLLRLLRDPELRRRFSEAGRRAVEERYSLAVNAPRVIGMFRGALERSGGAVPVVAARTRPRDSAGSEAMPASQGRLSRQESE